MDVPVIFWNVNSNSASSLIDKFSHNFIWSSISGSGGSGISGSVSFRSLSVTLNALRVRGMRTKGEEGSFVLKIISTSFRSSGSI